MKKAIYAKAAVAVLGLGAVAALGAGSALGYGYGYGYGYGSNGPDRPIVVPPAKFQFSFNLARGMRGEAVVQLQERLRAAGYFTYPVSTGYFGPITFAAVQAYQAANGIPNTGLVGILTRGALNR